MRRGLKSRYILFILSLFMAVGVFLPRGGALAGEAKKADSKGKYNINIDINIKNKEKMKEELKNGGVIEPSGRQVMVYKLKVENELTDAQMLDLAQKYHKSAEKELSIKEAEEKLKNDKLFDGEGILSETGKLVYDGKAVDRVELKKVEDPNLDKLTGEIIEINDLEEGYYLIKETDESKIKKDEKLNTFVVKLSDKKTTKVGNKMVLGIKAKETTEEPKDYIKLIKVDAIKKDSRLNNAEFQLFKKVGDGKKDEEVKLTGENGVYYRDDKNGAPIGLKTWGNGEITVYNLDKGVKYYFKELKPARGYPEKDNVNKESEPVELGGTVVVENHRTPLLTKIDKDNKNKTLNGAVFEIYTKTDNKKLNFKKNDSGYEVDPKGEDKLVTKDGGFLNITNLEDGTYIIKETDAPEGYELEKIEEEFTVKNFNAVDKNGKVRVLVINNKLKPTTPTPTPENPKGGYHFVKIDSSKKENRLAGAKFVLMVKEGGSFKEFLKDGKRVILTSPSNGEFSISGLPYEGDGTEYALKEIEAPKNHTISQELTPFTVNAASSSLPAKKIVNEPYVPTTVTSKQNTITTRHVPGEITRVVKNPLVKTGDIRIVIMAIVGIILTIMGIRFVSSGERKQRM